MIASLRLLLSVTEVLSFWLAVTAASLNAWGYQSNQPSTSTCRVEAVDYKGWHAQQVSNQWVQLVLVPQNGGRLIQVTFGGHPFLFVNPKYAGKYLPPNPGQWFNYGGDKLWLLPEGNNDEQHWAGGSDLLDDGPYSFRKVSDGQLCQVELTGPADPHTGIQFQRTITLDADTPHIGFHASMKNITGHPVEWSMQSVSQYDTADATTRSRMNHDFWTFTPANPSSSYLNRYHVRFGPAENPAATVRDDGLFVLHYVHMAAELWLDSTDGWLAVVDGATQYAMAERFHYQENKPYPGKASIIFWTNGSEIKMNSDGEPALTGGEEGQPPYYLEAELNSPLCRLSPGESCTFDTEWFPTRATSQFHGVTDAGIVMRPLRATRLQNGNLRLSGSFGVFFPGRLVAHLYNERGLSVGIIPGASVKPTEPVALELETSVPGNPGRISLHLEDEKGIDRGSLQEVRVTNGESY